MTTGTEKKPLLYLSGPMAGYPDHNYRAFRKAGELLILEGYGVINPIDHHGPHTSWKECIPYDLVLMKDADAVIFLEGWERSQGARIEALYAMGWQLPPYSYPDPLFSKVDPYDVFPPYEVGPLGYGPTTPSPLSGGPHLPPRIHPYPFGAIPKDVLQDYMDHSSWIPVPSPVPQSSSPSEPRIHPYPLGTVPISSFTNVLLEMQSIHEKKSQDYGSSTDPYANIRASVEFGIPAWVGAVVRANDKTTRIKSFIQRGELANEPIRDALLDAATYYAIALMLYDEGEHGE